MTDTMILEAMFKRFKKSRELYDGNVSDHSANDLSLCLFGKK